MPKFTDLNVSDIKNLYLKHNLMPEKGHMAIIKGKCCLLGILVKEAGLTHPVADSAFYDKLGLTQHQISDIIAGFDGGAQENELQSWAAKMSKELGADYAVY